MLRLLGVLHQINSDWRETGSQLQRLDSATAVTGNVFVNNKLTAKLNRQLEEPMIVASNCLPDWAMELPQLFPFLFPFETRYTYLQSTAFGYARLMQKWLQSARDSNPSNSAAARRDENLSFLGRLQRQKVRISRQRLFESAFKVFELYGSSKAMLEVEYFDEVGTGLGPTLEFYAMVSKEFRKKGLGLWRGSEGGSAPSSASVDGASDAPGADAAALGSDVPASSSVAEYVHSAEGLFPAPVDINQIEHDELVTKGATFKVLGMVLAKALMDSRIVDIPFSKTFLKLVLNQHVPLTTASIKVRLEIAAIVTSRADLFSSRRPSTLLWPSRSSTSSSTFEPRRLSKRMPTALPKRKQRPLPRSASLTLRWTISRSTSRCQATTLSSRQAVARSR